MISLNPPPSLNSTLYVLIHTRYIVYDVQMLMGGTHQCRVSPDEYVFATINIYLDIINLVRWGSG